MSMYVRLLHMPTLVEQSADDACLLLHVNTSCMPRVAAAASAILRTPFTINYSQRAAPPQSESLHAAPRHNIMADN